MVKIRYVLFDLDGTLLPVVHDEFEAAVKRNFDALFSKHFGDLAVARDVFTQGIHSILTDQGRGTNEARFKAALYAQNSIDSDKLLWVLGEYYHGDYNKVKKGIKGGSCGRQAINIVRHKGCKAVLATAPIWPEECIATRLSWAGLEPSDFACVTTYEHYCYSKPDLRYYLEVARKLRVRPSECLMIGNDTDHDMRASAAAGLECYLMTDYCIDRTGTAHLYKSGNAQQMLLFLSHYLQEGGQ